MKSETIRYEKLHIKIVEGSFHWGGWTKYFYTADLSGECECGKKGLAHNYVLDSPSGKSIVLGSTCILRHSNFEHLFKNDPKGWEKLKSEINDLKDVFRAVRASDELRSEKLDLTKLRELKKTVKTDRQLRAARTRGLMKELEAYAEVYGMNFARSLLSQAKEGRVLSRKQISVFEKIQDQKNETPEQVLAEYEKMKEAGSFEDDVLIIASQLSMGSYDRGTHGELISAFERYGRWNDYNLERAEKLMYKYRKQISVLFWDIVDAKNRDGELTKILQNQVDAINQMVEHEIISLLPRDGTVNEIEKTLENVVEFVKPGVYELPTGEIYVVKLNREGSRTYAKRLVESPSERVTESGKVVDFDFEYEASAIYKIRPEHLMNVGRAKDLMIRYSRCIVCGRRLKVAESVERGIGPVCIKYFGV